MTSTTPSIIPLVPTQSHTSIHLQHYPSQHFFIHNKTPHMYIHPYTQTQNNPNSEIYRTTPLIITSTLHNTPNPFMPSPQKNAPKQVTEKALSKKCKNQSCRDALPAKNTSPKTNETSDNAHRKACTDYPHITARCIYRVPTIPTSFQPHPSQTIPHTRT